MRKLLIKNESEDSRVLEVKKLNEIVYIESFEGNTKAFYCEGKEGFIKRCLSQVEEKLPDDKFFKIHKSIIINIDYLVSINMDINKTVLMKNGKELKIAHRRYKDFIKFVKLNFDIWL